MPALLQSATSDAGDARAEGLLAERRVLSQCGAGA
jgi:hypothetical protein